MDVHHIDLFLVGSRQGVVILLADVLALCIRCTIVNHGLIDNIEGLRVGTSIDRESGVVHLVVTHLLISLTSNKLTRVNGMRSIVVIVVSQRTCTVIVSIVLY